MSMRNLAVAGPAELVERTLMDTRKCLVAVVTELNEENALCVTVQPAVKKRVMMPTNREIGYAEMMPIVDVPVADIGGIRKIPEVGDHGILIFHDVDFQKYLNTRELSDLASARFHDYSDAMFFPFEVAKVGRPEPYLEIGCDYFRFKHGLSVEGDLYVDGDVKVTGSIGVDGDLYVDGNIRATESVRVDEDLFVDGDIQATGDIGANGDISVGGSLKAFGNIGAAGDVVAGSGSVSLQALAISHQSHMHTSSPSGGLTSPPTPPAIVNGVDVPVSVVTVTPADVEPVEVEPIECPEPSGESEGGGPQ